jgi:hypothetical protein
MTRRRGAYRIPDTVEDLVEEIDRKHGLDQYRRIVSYRLAEKPQHVRQVPQLVKLAFDNGEEIALPLAWFQGTPVWTELAKQKRLDD